MLSNLFNGDVAAFETDGLLDASTLLPDEAAFISGAKPKRAAEFSTGRACARFALAELGIQNFAIRVGPNREPLWPEGVSGSITHTKGFCGAVVARKSLMRSLGIDAELYGAVHRSLWPQIATAEEIRGLNAVPTNEAVHNATVLFSAKEAFFKCQFPLTRQWIDFHEVSVKIESMEFEILPRKPLRLEGYLRPPWRGRHALHRSVHTHKSQLFVIAAFSTSPSSSPVSQR